MEISDAVYFILPLDDNDLTWESIYNHQIDGLLSHVDRTAASFCHALVAWLRASQKSIFAMSLSPRNSVYNAGPQLLRDVWGLTAVAILIIILRVIAKLRIGKFGADDILMVSALVSSSPFL